MEEIVDKVNQLLDIDVGHLSSEILRQSKIHAEIQKIYLKQVEVMNSLNTEYAKLKLYRWQFYMGKLPSSAYAKEKCHVNVLKTDVDKYLEADTVLCEMKEKVKNQEAIIKFLEDSLKRVGSRGYEIKASMDWQKFIAGS